MFSKGNEMMSLVFIFVGCAVLMFAAIYVYNQKESTAFHDTQAQIRELSAKIKEQETLLASNISTVANGNLRIKAVEDKVTCFTGKVDSFSSEVDHLQEHCAKLREGQIDLRALLAAKRPVLKAHGPIEVQVVTPQQKLRMDAKKIKKQIKDNNL